MRSVRPAAVAGLFYTAHPDLLRAEVLRLLGAAHGGPGRFPKALVVPHAGYVYSGAIAASGYATLGSSGGRIRRVVLLGPAHREAVRGLALPGADALATPLGEVEVDAAAVEAVLPLPQVVVSAGAHAREHALEVHLPFLQVALGSFRVVPLTVGQASEAEVAEVLSHLWGGPETLIVVSSDLSHYLPHREGRRTDEETARRVITLEGALRGDDACGAIPLNGLLYEARRRHMTCALLDLRSSGDTAGDRSRVVGYGAFALYEAAS